MAGDDEKETVEKVVKTESKKTGKVEKKKSWRPNNNYNQRPPTMKWDPKTGVLTCTLPFNQGNAGSSSNRRKHRRNNQKNKKKSLKSGDDNAATTEKPCDANTKSNEAGSIDATTKTDERIDGITKLKEDNEDVQLKEN